MRILVSGSTGFLGTFLIKKLEAAGHTIGVLVRPQSRADKIKRPPAESVSWDPIAGEFDATAAEGFDCFVHLAGASIADGRWNGARKNLLRTSRIDTTRYLMEGLSKLDQPPRVVVAASAVGYYGSRGDEVLSEGSAPGDDFLSTLCVDWEAETARARKFDARVVNLRFGIILAAHGGALPRMALPFRMGAGGRLGSGKQWMSWLTLSEAASIVEFALTNPAVSGAVNAVSPTPIQNVEFTRILAKTLHRPALFPAPAFALRLALGEMADALLLSSQRVLPSILEKSGYKFEQPVLADALASIFRS